MEGEGEKQVKKATAFWMNCVSCRKQEPIISSLPCSIQFLSMSCCLWFCRCVAVVVFFLWGFLLLSLLLLDWFARVCCYSPFPIACFFCFCSLLFSVSCDCHQPLQPTPALSPWFVSELYITFVVVVFVLSAAFKSSCAFLEGFNHVVFVAVINA